MLGVVQAIIVRTARFGRRTIAMLVLHEFWPFHYSSTMVRTYVHVYVHTYHGSTYVRTYVHMYVLQYVHVYRITSARVGATTVLSSIDEISLARLHFLCNVNKTTKTKDVSRWR